MILTLGTGRCGSTTVARVLGSLGVDMGGPGELSTAFPDGDREDPWVTALSRDLKYSRITRDEWRDSVRAYAATKTEPWGLKIPLMAEFPGLALATLEPTAVIWIVRDLEATVRSWVRWMEGGADPLGIHPPQERELLDDYCRTWVAHRHYSIAAHLWGRTHIPLNMTERADEGDLAHYLHAALTVLLGEGWTRVPPPAHAYT